jgi:phospholipase/carboxylesterase
MSGVRYLNMSAARLSLHHLLRPPKVAAGIPPLLILLHGIGSNEDDLFALGPYLDERFLILSARAPITLTPGSFAWFPVEFISETPRIDPVEAERSRSKILEFIREALHAYNADPTRVYLMGFSQGAVMSLSVMLTQPEALAGVVAMSGRILPEVKPNAVSPDRLNGFPILVQHGEYDNVLPVSHGRASRDYLSTLPVNLTYREYPMAHQITEESLSDIRGWLSGQLDVEAGKQDV